MARKTFEQGEAVEVVPDHQRFIRESDWTPATYVASDGQGWHRVKLSELNRALVPARRIRKLRTP